MTFDPIAEAEKALEARESPAEVVQRFAIHTAREHQLGELDALLGAFDGWSSRSVLLSWLVAVLDEGHLALPGEVEAVK